MENALALFTLWTKKLTYCTTIAGRHLVKHSERPLSLMCKKWIQARASENKSFAPFNSSLEK
jgi:hypothetical protein